MMINLIRRRFVGISMLAVAFPTLLAACSSAPQPRTYAESINTVMVSLDKRHIVFFGVSHHYVFDMPPRLLEILESPWKDRLKGVPHQFRVLPDRTVDGAIYLQIDLDKNDSPNAIWEINKLMSQVPNTYPIGYVSSELISLRGKRYDSAADIQPGQSQKLNHTYMVDVYEWPDSKTLRDYNDSPVTKLSNGALTIFAKPLFLLILVTGK